MRIGLGINNDLIVTARGDALSIMLSERGGQQASWSIDVWAEIDGRGSAAGRGRGSKPRTYIGTFNTPAAVNSLQTNRIVGQAVCPGARAWVLSTTGPTPPFQPTGATSPIDASAELDASPSPCCGLTTGIYFPNRVPTTTAFAGVSSGIVTQNPTLFSSILAVAPLAGEASTVDYIMLFNATAVPANGTAPAFGYSFPVPPGGSINYSLSVPQFFSNGLVWAASSTANTLTLDTALFTVSVRTPW